MEGMFGAEMLARERHREMLEEAEKERLAREVRGGGGGLAGGVLWEISRVAGRIRKLR
jgi:hypothetical protein